MQLKTASENKQSLFLVFTLFALGWATIKISLPVLPQLTTIFHTSESTIKLTISLFLFGYAFSQLIWATLAEMIGRRIVILIALSFAIVGGIIITFSTNMPNYILGRILEGIGMGVASPLGRAILADTHDRQQIARALAAVSSVNCLMPALIPIICGFILFIFGWRYIFISFTVILAMYTFWFYKSFPETKRIASDRMSFLKTFQGYFWLLKQSKYWGFILPYVLLQSTLVGYYAAMPFWYVSTYHIPEHHYAFLAIFSVAAYLFGLMLTRYLVRFTSTTSLLKMTLWVSLGISLITLLFALTHQCSLILLVLLMSLFAFCPAVAFPCANANVMNIFKERAAMAAALSSTLMFFTAGIMTWVESHLNVTTLWQLSLLLMIIALVSLFTFYRWALDGKKSP